MNRSVSIQENPDYLSRQLVTYIGNKRALLGPIGDAVERVKRRLGRDRLRFLDLFSGSGIVSRFMKAHASLIVSNDLEDYAEVIGRCFLANESDVDLPLLQEIVDDLNARVDRLDGSSEHVAPAAGRASPGFVSPGFIEEMYAPADENAIGPNDRVFYTRANARRLDGYRQLIASVPRALGDFLLAPLLSKASIHANTAGVFKGFYKDRRTKVGQYGGSGQDALARILGQIRLEPPVFSRFECPFEVMKEDADAAARLAPPVDLVYLDPPYNQHPYGSNYFMLNLLVRYQRPQKVSRVSGIPADWNRSAYNVRAESLARMRSLVEALRAPFLLVSYNNEGFITPADMQELLTRVGRVEVVQVPYNAFRGSRSLRSRPVHVTEHLFLVERS